MSHGSVKAASPCPHRRGHPEKPNNHSSQFSYNSSWFRRRPHSSARHPGQVPPTPRRSRRSSQQNHRRRHAPSKCRSRRQPARPRDGSPCLPRLQVPITQASLTCGERIHDTERLVCFTLPRVARPNMERTKKVHFRGNSISSLRYPYYRFRSHSRAGGT
jgi:hypothetical protein